jgi:hypothetical protein
MKNRKVMFVKYLLAVFCLVSLVGIVLLAWVLLPKEQFFAPVFLLPFVIAFPVIILSKYALPLYLDWAEKEWQKRKQR